MDPARIEKAKHEDFSAWDAYVLAHEEGTFFHRSGWYRVIQSSYGHKPHYLLARDEEGNIRGVLPLFETRSLLFGHALVSTPFCVYGGALGDDVETVRSLEDAAAELADELKVDYLELRNRVKTRDDWPAKSLHTTFVREIAEDDEAILLSIKNKQRAVVRKAIRNELTRKLQDTCDDFFYAYSVSVRNLGTPVFPRRYFENLVAEFGDDCEVVSIFDGEQLHSSLISFYYKNTVLPYYGGGLPESRGSKAMDFMYFDQMCRARAAGFELYDFGRSKVDSGPYHYKRHWGFEAQPLHYQYYLVKSESPPELNPNNPRYQLMISVWRKMPLWLSQRLGPFVSRFLG